MSFTRDPTTLDEYRSNLEEALGHCTSYAQTDKYVVVDGLLVPKHYPGITLLGGPLLGPDDNVGCWLDGIGRQLARHLPCFAPVCIDEAHVTICDIEAGSAFAEHLGTDHERLDGFLHKLSANLQRIESHSAPIRFRLAGLGWFPNGPVVGFLDITDAESFSRIVAVREAVGAAAVEHDVAPLAYGFLGHLTIGYAASPLSPNLLSAVLAPYRSMGSGGLDFSITEVRCFGFSDMSEFSPLGPAFPV